MLEGDTTAAREDWRWPCHVSSLACSKAVCRQLKASIASDVVRGARAYPFQLAPSPSSSLPPKSDGRHLGREREGVKERPAPRALARSSEEGGSMRRSLLLMISRPWFLEDRSPKVTVEIGALSVGFSGLEEGRGRGQGVTNQETSKHVLAAAPNSLRRRTRKLWREAWKRRVSS